MAGFHDILHLRPYRFNHSILYFGDQVGSVIAIVDYPRMLMRLDQPDCSAAWCALFIHVTPTDPYQLIRSITIAVGELHLKL